jgi:hypothetical protein
MILRLNDLDVISVRDLPCRSGKKVGRREDLLNIEVSGLGRIRQRDPGMGFSLLVYKILQDGFGIDPDEFFPQE